MDKKRRIKYIDLCKGLGILMVTWGHITKLDIIDAAICIV